MDGKTINKKNKSKITLKQTKDKTMENEFLRLTDKDTGKNIYIRKKDIVIVAPLTENILHKNDYNYTDIYDKKTIFSGVQTEYGLVHVKERPDKVMRLIHAE